MPNRLSGAAQRSGALRVRSGALRRSPGPWGLCSAQQAPSSSAGAQGLCSALGALRLSAGAQGPCGKQGVLRRPGARSIRTMLRLHPLRVQLQGVRGDTMDTVQSGQPSGARVQECRGKGLAQGRGNSEHRGQGRGGAGQGRSDTHKTLRGCAVLSRRAAAGTQRAVPRSGCAQALTERSGAVQRSGGAQQRAPSWRCSAKQAIRRAAGTQELHSAQGALSGARWASRWCSAQGALSDAQGRSGVA